MFWRSTSRDVGRGSDTNWWATKCWHPLVLAPNTYISWPLTVGNLSLHWGVLKPNFMHHTNCLWDIAVLGPFSTHYVSCYCQATHDAPQLTLTRHHSKHLHFYNILHQNYKKNQHKNTPTCRDFTRLVMGCLHDLANVQQTVFKIQVLMLDVCWTFGAICYNGSGSLLDRVNTI